MPSHLERNDAIKKTRVAVMGAGAVGSYFGGMLARAGVQVTLITRPAHAEAIRRGGLFLDALTFQEHIAITAATEAAAVRDADLVLFCVKTLDTEAAAQGIAPHLSRETIVVSLQNGVDNVARIRAAAGIDALPAVVYIAVALPEPGHVKHSGRGELVIGELTGDAHETPSAQPPRTERVVELFSTAGVPCKISVNIEADLWTKMIMNCAGNAVAAIAQTSYGNAIRNPSTRELMIRLIHETVAVARAAGVRLPEIDFAQTGMKFIESIGNATSSTAQDVARGKRTEIDSLNGYIARRGTELGVAVPMNFAMFALVKLLEETAAQRARPAGTSQ